ncbi:MAG: helix-turn-helix domain-containing protein [Acidithiobacillus sp.]
MQTQIETVSPIVAEIGRPLGYPPESIPTQIDEKKTAEVLGVKTSTLTNWRTTGRYALPYVKVGRLVRYRIVDLAAWIAKRRTGAEG